MAAGTEHNEYVSYPMFKGLQKPLEFMGIQGRYITWAACAVGGAILGFIIAYCIFGFVVGLIGRPRCVYLRLFTKNVIFIECS